MRTLPAHYSLAKHYSDYDLIERNEAVALYSQSVNGIIRGYEVYLVRIRPPSHAGNFQFEGGECLPPDSQWGITAWTCQRLERAREKFAELSTPERIAAAIKARERFT